MCPNDHIGLFPGSIWWQPIASHEVVPKHSVCTVKTPESSYLIPKFSDFSDIQRDWMLHALKPDRGHEIVRLPHAEKALFLVTMSPSAPSIIALGWFQHPGTHVAAVCLTGKAATSITPSYLNIHIWFWRFRPGTPPNVFCKIRPYGHPRDGRIGTIINHQRRKLCRISIR